MAAPAKPQYQHFVPQFLLRNFSHPYKPDGEGPKRRKAAGKRKYEKGMHPKDPVVRNLDLLAESPLICEKPVARILGQMNMYLDTSKPTEHQQHVEEMLSVLECQASKIFRKITKAFEQKEAGLWLTRKERDLLRKFLFLLKYRGDRFRQRFFHQAPEEYNANDKELLREYMSAHGFKRPLDIWFHNIKTIINLDMDPGREWVLELRKRIYPEDAMWFAAHVGCSYMAICTPADTRDEFILTDNSYNVFEGPNHFAQDVDTGEVGGVGHTPLHEFAPISPKLMIVLRSNILPNPLEDAVEEVKTIREFQRSLALGMMYLYEFKWLLADLPIEKARNNYTEIVNGRLTLLGGENGKPRTDHEFCFKFFPISSDQVHMINALLLDNVAPCTSVVFESQESFARTLEWYLTAPCTVGKILTSSDIDADHREAALKKLEKVSRDLGSRKETVFLKIPNAPIVDYEGYRQEYLKWKRDMNRLIDRDADPLDDIPDLTSSVSPQSDGYAGFWELYLGLGGSILTLIRDMEQAQRMWRLRVKIDVWSKGVDESIRERNRGLLLDAYLRLPARRVWIFIKCARFEMLRGRAKFSVEDKVWAADMAEDVVARAHHLVAPDRLAKLIYVSGMNNIDKTNRPWLDLWTPSTDDSIAAVGLFRIYASRSRILFQTPGYIRDCGIPEIRVLACQAQLEIAKTRRHAEHAPDFGMFEEGDKIELLTRLMVRERVIEEKPDLQGMDAVLFDTAYPTPPASWRYSL